MCATAPTFGSKNFINTKDDRSLLEDCKDCEGDSFPKIMDLDELGADVEDKGKVIPEEELPFEALDINNLAQEEDFESIRTSM